MDKFAKVTYSGDAHHDQHNVCLMEAVGKEINVTYMYGGTQIKEAWSLLLSVPSN